VETTAGADVKSLGHHMVNNLEAVLVVHFPAHQVVLCIEIGTVTKMDLE
jgi:hypothetical protein